MPEFNWVGESFADSLSDLLKVPSLTSYRTSERKIIQQRLRIPLTTLAKPCHLAKTRPRERTQHFSSRGNTTSFPHRATLAATMNVTAKIIRVNEGRFLNEELPDGRRVTRDINLNDALGNLQTMQGQIAYQILYQRDKALPFSQNQLIEAANKVPARAFEAYIKGLLTRRLKQRKIILRTLSGSSRKSTPDATYSDAALELGHLYLGQRKFPDAIDSFERVINANQQCREKAKAENKARAMQRRRLCRGVVLYRHHPMAAGKLRARVGGPTAIGRRPEANQRL